MKHKFRIGDKVRILWDKSGYSYGPDYDDVGKVLNYYTTHNGTFLVVISNFHKKETHFCLGFPLHTIRPLREMVKDGDIL